MISSESTVACPVCGRDVPQHPGRRGRPAVWCSKSCRQTAHRARQAMAQAEKAANAILAQLAMAMTDYNNAQDLLHGGYRWMGEVAAATDGDPGRALGDRTIRWEKGLAQAALRVAQAAGRIEDLAHAHDRHAADYRRAREVIRPLEDRRWGVDENPATIAAPVDQSADGLGGQDHADVDQDVDRDELFDAIEDLIAAFEDELPGELEAATADPLAQLHAVLQVQDGAGPLEELAAAGRGLADAIADYRNAPTTPAALVKAVDRLARALPAPGLPAPPAREPAPVDHDQVDLADLQEAARLIITTGYGSVSTIQIRMRITSGESARLMEVLEAHGIVGPSPGGRKFREVLIGVDQLEETLAALPQPRADF